MSLTSTSTGRSVYVNWPTSVSSSKHAIRPIKTFAVESRSTSFALILHKILTNLNSIFLCVCLLIDIVRITAFAGLSSVFKGGGGALGDGLPPPLDSAFQ